MTPIRRKAKPFLADQVLGVYKGPNRTAEPPKVTSFQLRLLRAIHGKKIKRGQGQFARAWRLHEDGAAETLTKHVNRLIACRWAKVVGAHVELTEAGLSILDGAA